MVPGLSPEIIGGCNLVEVMRNPSDLPTRLYQDPLTSDEPLRSPIAAWDSATREWGDFIRSAPFLELGFTRPFFTAQVWCKLSRVVTSARGGIWGLLAVVRQLRRVIRTGPVLRVQPAFPDTAGGVACSIVPHLLPQASRPCR
jgi:hypothetical protein